jgi:hypothetical protein
MAGNEVRPLVVAISFIATFATLVGYIPTGFWLTDTDYRLPDVPDYFDSTEILSYNFTGTENFNITHDASGTFIHSFTIGGWNIRFRSQDLGSTGSSYLQAYTYDYWWIFEWNYEFFYWVDSQGRKVTTYPTADPSISWSKLDEIYSELGTLKFTWQNSKVRVTLWIGFNETKYTKPSDALDNNEASILCGITFDQVNTSVNAWTLIGMLLFFQMPSIHPAINFIIAVPFWACIIYLVYVLILKAIPFVGG